MRSPSRSRSGGPHRSSKRRSPERRRRSRTRSRSISPSRLTSEPVIFDSWKMVRADQSNFDAWMHLLNLVDQYNDIPVARNVYDRFLEKYPFCYGFWKKYAEMERRNNNLTDCIKIWERAVTEIPLCCDLWIGLLGFMKEVAHVAPVAEDGYRKVNSLYDRAIDIAGMEFNSDRLWNDALMWHESRGNWHKVCEIYDRLIKTPTSQFKSHYDRYLTIINMYEPDILLSEDEYTDIFDRARENLDLGVDMMVTEEKVIEEKAEVDGVDVKPSVIIRKKHHPDVLAFFREELIERRTRWHEKTAIMLTSRLQFEEQIKRPYFHVNKLETAEVKNWCEYLDYEIEEGIEDRIETLFERCVIACALYDTIWVKAAYGGCGVPSGGVEPEGRGQFPDFPQQELFQELAIEELSANLDRLHVGGEETAQDMHTICSDLTERIQQNKEKTQHLLNQTNALQNQKKHLEIKQKVIDEFLRKYSLTESETRALDGNPTDGSVSSDFFPALARARDIYQLSKQLLRTSGEHSAALEIMEDMSKRIEAAYEVLYRSIQRECRILNSDYVELKGVLCQSFAALQDREVLLKYALEEFCTARKNQILRLYIDALTKGAHGSGKPIELMSHDPLRYMGDMLAWIHEAIEGQRDLLRLLLKNCKPEILKDNTAHVLDVITSALCRPFKVRVEQALAAESDSVILYKISGLFNFYGDKMTPIVGADSELSRTVIELNQLALTIFYSGLNSTVQKILGKMGAPDYDLLPVQAVHQVLMLLRDVLESRDVVMSGRSNAKDEFNKIFSYVLDPLYRAVQIAATQLHSPLDVAVYTLNCLTAIEYLFILYQFSDTRLEMIKALLEANEDVLVSEEASAILANTGLIVLYTKASAHDTQQGPLSSLPGMDTASVQRVISQFDSFLAQPESCKLDQVSKISSSRVREAVHKRTMENVVAAYNVVLKKIEDPSNKYEQLQLKSVEQIKELLL